MVTRYGCLLLGVVAALLFLAALLTCRITGLPVSPTTTNERPSPIEESPGDAMANQPAGYLSKGGGE